MLTKLWLGFLVLPTMVVAAYAQDAVRDLKGPGQFGKFLTPGQLDRWVFDGEKGETIIAHVVTKEFDPILELVQAGAKDDDKVLLEVDDPGSESRFSFRLPEKGQYKIRVHGFNNQGGGNYTLTVQRFQAAPLATGQSHFGTFDRAGKGYHHFPAEKDQILIPKLTGSPAEDVTLLDFKGRPIPNWAGSVLVEDDGECHLIVTGPPEQRYELAVRKTVRHDLAEGRDHAGSLQAGAGDVWTFDGKPGDFRLLELGKKGELQTRLIYAPPGKKRDARLPQPGERPEIQYLPVASRGGRVRYAAILGREGRYQLQIKAESPASYTLSLRDPGVPLAWGKESPGQLPVGGTAFYSFKAAPGQLIQASLTSERLVPLLRLYDAHGGLVGTSGDDTDALEGRVTHMVMKEGLYRLQVSSLGDGGGGDFRVALKEGKIKELKIGDRGQGAVEPEATEFWAFAGKEGQTVFLNVRSPAFQPTFVIRSPDGVRLAAENKGSPATGTLVALKLPKTGRYTVAVSSQRSAGEYTVRLLDGD